MNDLAVYTTILLVTVVIAIPIYCVLQRIATVEAGRRRAEKGV